MLLSILVCNAKFASSRENMSSEFATRVDSNRPAQLRGLAKSLEISAIAIGYMPVYGNPAPCRGFLQTYIF